MPLGDLTFLHAGKTPRCDARVDKRFEGYHTLQFGAQGGVELFYDDQRWLLESGTSWFWTAFPGPHIRFHAAPNRSWWEHRYVAFQGPRVARWIADGIWPDTPQIAPRGGQATYVERFDALLALTRQTDRWAIARAVNLLEALLLELAEDRAPTRPVNTAREPWLDALLTAAESPGDFVSDYARFAREHGMGLSTLRRRFREATGTPLHEWALQARIARARALLGDSDLPIKAVAERLGYSDVYFFTRQFRERVGVPPAAYRRSRQG